MNKKAIWIPGVPTVDGVYWFDIGARLNKDDRQPFVLKIHSNSAHIFADNGSGPLSMIYNPKICKHASWAHIVRPSTWDNGKCIKEKRSRAWVKHPKGYLGIGLISPGIHDNIGGTIVWINNPDNGAICGTWIHNNERYLYCPIQFPKAPKLIKEK